MSSVVIGIDAREAAAPAADQRMGAAGRARYVHELVTRLPALAPETGFVLYTNRALDDELPGANARWSPVIGGGPAWHVQVARRAVRECTVYFSSATYVTPQLLRMPYVQTVYDLIPFRGGTPSHGVSARLERLTFRRTARRARAILAISRATADDLARVCPVAAAKVTVTPLAADRRFRPRSADETEAARRRLRIDSDFVLATGTIEPRKNFERLVRAHATLPADLRRRYPLVIVGRKGWATEPLFAAIAAAERGTVRHLEFVSDEDLAALYASATVFCYPSLHEGFGLPILEAMQAGAPVVTSRTSSLPEVGGDAARYVDPLDEADLSKALATLLTSPAERERMRAAGLANARRFDWERTARTTLDVLHAAAR